MATEVRADPCAGSGADPCRFLPDPRGKDISARAVNVLNKNPSQSLSGKLTHTNPRATPAAGGFWVVLGVHGIPLGHLGLPWALPWGGFGPLWVILGRPWGPQDMPKNIRKLPMKRPQSGEGTTHDLRTTATF